MRCLRIVGKLKNKNEDVSQEESKEQPRSQRGPPNPSREVRAARSAVECAKRIRLLSRVRRLQREGSCRFTAHASSRETRRHLPRRALRPAPRRGAMLAFLLRWESAAPLESCCCCCAMKKSVRWKETRRCYAIWILDPRCTPCCRLSLCLLICCCYLYDAAVKYYCCCLSSFFPLCF